MEISRFENRARKSGKLAHKEAYNKFVLSLVAFSGEDPFWMEKNNRKRYILAVSCMR